MTAPSSIDPAHFLHEQLAQASPDVLRQMLTTFINTLKSAKADAARGVDYGTRSAERVNTRNGYQQRDFDTPRRHAGGGHSQAAVGIVLPRLAARAPPSGRAGTDHHGRHLLSAGRLDPADGASGRVVRPRG